MILTNEEIEYVFGPLDVPKLSIYPPVNTVQSILNNLIWSESRQLIIVRLVEAYKEKYPNGKS